MGLGSVLHASLRKRRGACKKGEQTLGFSLPCEQGLMQLLALKSAEGNPTHLLKIAFLNPGHSSAEGV